MKTKGSKRGDNMTTREMIENMVETWKECDEECDDCLLGQYVNIFGREVILCRIISQAWNEGILTYKKVNGIK